MDSVRWGRGARPNGARPSLLGRILRCLPLVVILGSACPSPVEGQRIPADASWKTFETTHFRVSFTSGIEDVARRAAVRAERAWELLAASGFTRTPGLPIDLLVTDNVDYANGNAITTPWNRIVVHAHPPAGDPELGFHDDWMELLVLHELAHIFHLESGGGIWPVLRAVLGRNPGLFPQYLAPDWLIEGLAIHFESAGTGAGRARSTVFEMMIRTAAAEGTFFGIDRATFGPARWPGGATGYVYGAGFVEALVRRSGAESLIDTVDRYGRRVIPWRLDASARQVLGSTFTAAWREWLDDVEADADRVAKRVEAAGRTVPEMLTEHGRYAHYPRYSPADGSLAYARSTGRDEPTIAVIMPDGRHVGGAWTVDLGPPSWTPDGREFVYASLEFAGPNELYADLYRAAPGSGPRRLTHGARLRDPDVNPRDGSIVAVSAAGGTNVLALVNPETGEIRPLSAPDPDLYWSTPRWSPRGDRIAVGRWRSGNADIVVLDSTGVLVGEVTRDRAVDIDPTWSPNGRYIVFGSDRTGIHNLFAWDTVEGELRQVTNVLTGAFQPDVSPRGDWIAFSYYGPNGYDIARIPFDPPTWRTPEAEAARSPAGLGNRYTAVDEGGELRPYSAWSTVLPRFWTPRLRRYDDLGTGVGLYTRGEDVAERHRWSADLLVFPEGRNVDGGFSYSYRGRANPVVGVSTRQEWLVQVGSGEVAGNRMLALLRRERVTGLSFLWRRPRVRSAMSIATGAEVRETALSWSGEGSAEAPAPADFPREEAIWLAAGVATTRAYELTLGVQSGVSASARLDARRRDASAIAEGSTYWRLLTRGRAYRAADWFGFAPSVFAFRLDGGVEASRATIGLTVGDDVVRAPDDAGAGTPLLSGGTRLAVRGYPAGSQGGTRAVAGSFEYRFPIALVERGFRLAPIAVDRFWGDLFVDAGAAWCPETCTAVAARVPTSPRPLLSVGGELIGRLRLGFSADLTFRAGAAIPLRETPDSAPVLYFRTGTSF